jgi:vitamin B12 transporter
MKANNHPITAITLGCALLLSHFAFADESMQEDIDQIIVSGARTPVTINQLGNASTIITRAEIERREARHVSDLLRSVPGFSVSHTGIVGSQTQVRVRGAEANHILVLIDGVRANDPATGDEFRWEYLSTGNIERIEIVRGPQSSLWGSDAVSAVVHIITRTEASGSSFGGYAEGGSFGTSNAGLNGALGGSGWTLQGGIESLATDGSNISRSGNEKDDSDLTTANLSAKFSATESLSFSFGLRSVDAYTQFDPVDYFVTGLPTDGNVATDTQNLFAQAGVVLHRDGSHISHRLNVRYFDSDNRNLIDGIEDSSTASDRVSFAYQADVSIGENVLSFALEHEETQFDQTGAIVFGDPNQTQKVDVSSAVVEFQGLSLDRLTWIVSVRADDNSDFDNALNGRLSLAFDLSETTTLRASVGTGQKNPTFTERFGFFPGQFVGNPALQPEHSTSYDVGVDRSLADGAVHLQVSLFQQDLSDEINGFVFDPVTFLTTAENMSGKSRRSGVELASRWNMNDSLGIGAHYTYTDATEQDLLGNDVHELRRPKHSGGLSVDFRTAEERFSASLNADYGGSRTDIFFPPWPNPSEIVTLGNYWLLDLAAQFAATPSVTLFAKGSNLLDEDYEQVFGYRTQGRASYLGVRMNFGR